VWRVYAAAAALGIKYTHGTAMAGGAVMLCEKAIFAT